MSSLPRMSVPLLLIAMGVLAASLAACGPRNTPVAPPTTAPSTPGASAPGGSGGGRAVLAESTPGVRLRVEDAANGGAGAEALPTAATSPLAEAETAALLARLPELPESAAQRVSFSLRPGPKPPALTGNTIQAAWPPVATPSASKPDLGVGGPVHVVRVSPEGDVSIAPNLSVTFNQPMVPLTSVSELAAKDVPVRLSPAVPGSWRWLGTRTVVFEPAAGRLPMATSFSAEVPAGTKSATGGALAAAKSWQFQTPPVSVVTFLPPDGSDSVVREPVIMAVFDQDVEPPAILSKAAGSADGQSVSLRLATDAEVAADEAAEARRKEAKAGRWAAFKPQGPLPVGAKVEITFGPGLPSAEGPRVSDEAEKHGFGVFGPLTVKSLDCNGAGRSVEPKGVFGTSIDKCDPQSVSFNLTLSNPLDLDAFNPEAIRVEPTLAGQKVTAYDRNIVVSGRAAGQTSYAVILPAGLRDIFAQTLDKATTLTFKTGDAEPLLAGPPDRMVVLDPAAHGLFHLWSVNNAALNVTLYSVKPTDWQAFQDFVSTMTYPDKDRKPPAGTQAWRGQVEPVGKQDALVGAPIDLAPALKNGFGQVVVVAEPVGWEVDDRHYQNRPLAYWVQVTQLAIDAFAADGEAVVWVNRLADGSPVPTAKVTILRGQGPNGEASGRSDTAGKAVVKSPDTPPEDVGYEQLIIAESGDDLAFEPGLYSGKAGPPQDLGYLFTDRGIYQPGEDVHFKGWARRREGTDTRKLAVVADIVSRAIRFGLWNQMDNTEVVSGTLKPSAAGGFDGSFALGKDVAPGDYRLDLGFEADGVASGTGSPGVLASIGLRVAEFRRPEFEVRAASRQPFVFVGDANTVDATPSYYSGGGLGGSEVDWQVTGQPTTYTPPGNDDYVFGEWRPWFSYGADLGFGGAARSKMGFGGGIRTDFGGGGATESHAGRTDAEGRHQVAVTVEGVSPLSPVAVEAQATVHDVNRQAWSGGASYLVHPARFYVGLKPSRWFGKVGEALSVAMVVPDLDGKRLADVDIKVNIERLDWELVRGEYQEKATASGSCAATSKSGDEPAVCQWTPTEGGRYRFTADIADPEGRPNRTRLELWVAGAERQPPSETVTQGQVTLIPSQKEYRPGDRAEILIQAPFAPAEGMISIIRDGMVRFESVSLKDGSLAYQLPLTEDDMPNVHVQVDVVGADLYPNAAQDPRGAALPTRPAYATGDVSISVPPRARTLAVEASPAVSETVPGGEVEVGVSVRGADGKPVAGAEVALAVVDEAVLALTSYQLPDPIATFYPERYGGLATVHSRGHVQLAEELAGAGTAFAGGMGGGFGRGAGPAAGADMAAEVMSAMPAPTMADGLAMREKAAGQAANGAAGPAVRERVDLNPLAAFFPALVTDADGRASATFKLPDSVTRYRVMAVATDGALRFGKGESALTARLPLTVRPSAPRFLNYGDVFELPVVVQNQMEADVDASVVVRAVNLKLTGPAGVRVRVPARSRVEVRFPAAAAEVGTAVFQAGAFAPVAAAVAGASDGSRSGSAASGAAVGTSAGEAADAQRVTVPVYTPATTEAFATYGEVDQGGVVQPLQRPSDAAPEFGGLELTTTSTAVGQLADAYLYLHDYPFDCAEQVASRLMTTVALGDVLAAFKVADMPSKDEVQAAIKRDRAHLEAFDVGNGFAWWPGLRADPFVTVHAAQALAMAMAGDNSDAASQQRQRLAQYMSGIDALLDAEKITAGEGRWLVKAHALAVLRRLSDDPEAVAGVYSEAVTILSERGERDTETLGWLLQALGNATAPNGVVEALADIQRQLSNRVAEEAGKAVFRTDVREQDRYFLLASDSRSSAVALQGLMDTQPRSDLIPKIERGLLAARTRGRWATTQENAYVLVTLGDYFKRYEAEVPDFVARAWLGDGYLGESAFRGRSADRVDLALPMAQLPAGGPQPLTLAKEGAGRLYYRLGLRYAPQSLELAPLERGFSVARRYEAVDDPQDVVQTADGAWQVRAGSRVRVRLALVAESQRHHVALVDPLPAGFEAIDPDLAVSQAPPPDEGGPPVPLGDVAPAARVEPVAGDVFTLPGWEWWWSHQALRTERAEVFATQLPAGVHAYSYFARATTPGTFVVPPPRAEEMYAPETFGRGASNRVVVR